MDKSNYIFSHFNIIKKLKWLYIKIYFYWNLFTRILPRFYRRITKLLKGSRFVYFKNLNTQDVLKNYFRSNLLYNWWEDHIINKQLKKKNFYKLNNYLNPILFGDNETYKIWSQSDNYNIYIRKLPLKDIKFWISEGIEPNISSYIMTGLRTKSKYKIPNLYEWLKYKFLKRRYRLLNYLEKSYIHKSVRRRITKKIEAELKNFKALLKNFQLSFRDELDINVKYNKIFNFFSRVKYFNRLNNIKKKYIIKINKKTTKRNLYMLDTVTRCMVSCIWLKRYSIDIQHDLFFLKHIKGLLKNSENYSVWLLETLVNILNYRENYVDHFTRNIPLVYKRKKFKLDDLNFWYVLLERLYDRLFLSKRQRDLRKSLLTIDELIIAVLFGFKCQNLYFRLCDEQMRWTSKLFQQIKNFKWIVKNYVSLIIYNFFYSFKNKVISVMFRTLFGTWLNKQINFTTQFYGKHVIKKSKKELLHLFQQKYKLLSKYIRRKLRPFGSAMAVLLNLCGYRHKTFFDLSYLRVFCKAVISNNMFLLHKYFFLRSKATGIFRSSMRFYFLIATFLSLSSQTFWKPAGRAFWSLTNESPVF